MRAPLLALATGLIALVLAAVGCGSGGGQKSPASARAKVPSDFIGIVSEDLLSGDERYRRATIARQAAAGVELLRQTLDWARIETAPGRYDFSVYDPLVADLARRRIHLLPILFDPPPFRSSAPASGARHGTYPPRRASDMAAFAAAAVRRYGPHGSFWREHPRLPHVAVRSWQVWNEPNLPAYWASGPNATEYVRLLHATASAIRRLEPGAEIVSAGLPQSNLGVPFGRYLSAMYRAGAARAFDTLAIHPYALDAGGVVEAVAGARRLARRFGDRPPIWVTELGWASGGPRSPFTVGERGQGQLVGSSLDALLDRRGEFGVRGIVYYDWRDARPYGHDFFGLHTGLLRLDGSAKPALAAFERAAGRAKRAH